MPSAGSSHAHRRRLGQRSRERRLVKLLQLPRPEQRRGGSLHPAYLVWAVDQRDHLVGEPALGGARSETLSLSDLGLQGEEAKATQEVTGVEPVPAKGGGEIVEDPAEAPTRVADFLARAKVI